MGCDRTGLADVSVAGGLKAVYLCVPDGGALNGADSVTVDDM